MIAGVVSNKDCPAATITMSGKVLQESGETVGIEG
jgi:hypothetical protein